MNIRLVAIVPKGKLVDLPMLDRELKGAVNHGLNIINDDFQKTTATWRHNVAFKIDRAHSTGAALVGAVTTRDTIYGYVDQGTRPHIIRPRRARVLRFRGSHRAKTRPGIISSSAGGSSGPFVTARVVHHPGTAARNFAKTIEKRRERNMRTLLRAAFLKSLHSRA